MASPGRIDRRARSISAGLTFVAVIIGVAAACSDDSADSVPVEGRSFADSSDFVAHYWDRPIPLQGAPPEGLNPLETSLQPETCGTCHPQQFQDWGTTLHSGAYSPGLSGQLVNFGTYDQVRACLVCHAPLSEQSALVPDSAGALVSNPHFDKPLQRQGIVCAACHLRGWQRYGPPRRDGSLDPAPDGSPHGGATRTTFFEDSRFCSGCHQFAFPAPNGKSLQNTYEEWRGSRYASQGIICQTCHMPDRRHLWRGVHDSTMVASGVTVEWMRGSDDISLRVTNTGTGHRFPTYVTPEVLVTVEMLDGDRRPIPGATAEAWIKRSVEARGGVWIELSDTRLAPDSSLMVMASTADGASYARGSVIVYPDAFYERVFRGMLGAALSDTSRTLISDAHRQAQESVFSIFEDTVEVR